MAAKGATPVPEHQPRRALRCCVRVGVNRIAYTISPENMRLVERQYMEESGTTALALMERRRGARGDAPMAYQYHGAKCWCLPMRQQRGDGWRRRASDDTAGNLRCVIFQLSEPCRANTGAEQAAPAV
jgi:hypothetical protein